MQKIVFGIVVTFIIFLSFYFLGSFFQNYGHTDHEHIDIHIGEKADAESGHISHSSDMPDSKDGDSTILYLLNEFAQTDEPDKKLELAVKLAANDAEKGIGVMIELLEKCEYPFLCEEIISNIENYSHERFSYDPEKSNLENREAINRIKVWFAKKYH